MSSRELKQVAIIALVLLCATSIGGQAQDRVAVSFDQVDAHQIDISLLDSLHVPAAAADPDESAFPTQQAEVFKAWRGLLGDLAAHLADGGLEWTEPMRGFFRFYFREDGTIKQLVYNMRNLDPAHTTQFATLVDEFSQGYRFALSADQPFAQCSPAALAPPKRE